MSRYLAPFRTRSPISRAIPCASAIGLEKAERRMGQSFVSSFCGQAFPGKEKNPVERADRDASLKRIGFVSHTVFSSFPIFMRDS